MVPDGTVAYEQLLLNGRYPVGSRANFTCGQLYYPIGSDSSTCHSSGNWDKPTLICEGNVMFCSLWVLTVRSVLWHIIMSIFTAHKTGHNITKMKLEVV